MKGIPREDLLDVLACEIGKRPAAPTLPEIAPLATSIRRADGELLVEFPGDARRTVEAFAAAERQCCPGIGWSVEAGTVATLRISAGDAVLDTLAETLRFLNIEAVQ